ncbi:MULTISPECIES: hypothetical protein [unclassified Sphingobium]|nr:MULTISPECIES: hypothetical protein [unclassified Sphingobium]
MSASADLRPGHRGGNRHTGDVEPIEWLRKGRIDAVVRVAEGAFDYL